MTLDPSLNKTNYKKNAGVHILMTLSYTDMLTDMHYNQKQQLLCNLESKLMKINTGQDVNTQYKKIFVKIGHLIGGE